MFNTIKKRSEFVRIGKIGSRAKTDNLVVLCVKSDMQPSVVGYTASRRVGCAVLRNKAKRRLRSLVHEITNGSIVSFDGFSFVIIANQNTPVVNFQKLRSDFFYAIKKSIDRTLHAR